MNIEEITKRLNAATPRPWRAVPFRTGYGFYVKAGPWDIATLPDKLQHRLLPIEVRMADAYLIAHAPSDIAALLERVRELEAYDFGSSEERP